MASETKIKDPKRVEAAKKGRENYIKKTKDDFNRIFKTYLVQMTLKIYIDQFQQDLIDPASTLIAIEKTIRIMKAKVKNTKLNSVY